LISTGAFDPVAKQYTGFGDCQSIDEQSLNFYANATLTAVNFARINAPTDQLFSLISLKRENLNRLNAQNIFWYFKLEPNLIENSDFLSKSAVLPLKFVRSIEYNKGAISSFFSVKAIEIYLMRKLI
jgi:hypothetical protein